MKFFRYSAVLASLTVAFLLGCGGGGNGSSVGSSGGPPPFQARPFPGDFFALPTTLEYGSALAAFPANVVYDSNLKEFFFSDNALNEVEAYSTVDGHRIGAVTVPGAMGLSLSPDGTKLAVGSSTPQIYFVDPATLHVTGQVKVPTNVMDPATEFEPVMPFLMAAGPVLIEAAPPNSFLNGGGNLLSYDPGSGVFALANPPGANPDAGVAGAVPARSLDGNYLVLPTLGQAGQQMTVYSAQSQTYIGTTPIEFNISAVAANPDGSQFAMVGIPNSGMTQTVTFLNRSLQPQGVYPTQGTNIVYSRDGKYLYVRELTDVLALNAQTDILAGYQGLYIAPGQLGTLWDTDESNRVYGVSMVGAYVAGVAQLQAAAPQMPQFFADEVGSPNEGPLSGGTQVKFVPLVPGSGTADGIGSTMEAYFATAPATSDLVAGLNTTSGPFNFLTATAPAAAAQGPVTVLMTDASNNAVLLPAAYSYGPHVHWIDPSALSPAGGTVSTVLADGVEPPDVNNPTGANHPAVSIGGVPAIEVKAGNSWNELQVNAPAGNPGWADFKLSFNDGTSETTKNMVQYLAQDVTLPSAAYSSAVYDSTRDLFYLTGADNSVGVFNPETQTLLQPMLSSSVSSGAVLSSLALTPDDSKLLASDLTDHSVVVFDLTNNTSTAVNVLLASDGAATVFAPMPVAALTGNQAFVLLTTFASNKVRQIDLAQMTVRVRTDVQNSSLFSVAPSTMAGSKDGSTVLLGGATPGNNAPFYTWKYDAASDAFSPPMSLSYARSEVVAVNANGTILGAGPFTVDQNLLPLVPFPFTGLATLLPGNGALRYSTENELEISDTRDGRPLLTVAYAGRNVSSAFAVDLSGQKILICFGASLNYYQLAVVPLAVATVTPANAAPGTSLTILGSGFVTGTTATIAGKNASCTMVDAQTLRCSVPAVNAGLAPITLSNPDGQTFSFEAAVNVE